MKMYILTIITTLLLSSVGCSDDSSIDDTPRPAYNNEENNVSSNVATIYTTTGDGSNLLKKSNAEIISGVSMAPTTILINAAETKQKIDGFGFAITYSTCYNLLQMNAQDRADFLRQTYSESDGYGVSYARISIGCNDFSSTEYSLCDEKGLENFHLFTDETDYVIPILKEILEINPKVKIIAAPWTCPKWMKVEDIDTKAPYDRWISGHLNPDYRKDYATYFVKFIQAMKENGINIYAVTPQNEPLNQGNCASLYMPWQEEAPFVAELAAAFKQNNLSTKIYVFDHNYNYDDVEGQEDYPIKVYNALGNTFEGSELVVGAAYHDYGGSNSELSDIHQQASDKELIFSESSIGTWNDGRNLSKRLIEDMRNVILGTVNQWCKAVLVWNLMLDEKMGPNLDGGCQTCYGAVDIASDYKTISKNSHYYVISHIATVVRPDAQQIAAAERSVKKDGLDYSLFRNVDGSFAAVILNSSSEDVNATISDGSNYFSVNIPAQSVVSCNW